MGSNQSIEEKKLALESEAIDEEGMKEFKAEQIPVKLLLLVAKMGSGQSIEDKQLALRSKAIDKEVFQGYLAQKRTVKLLLLGAGEGGKSTVLKQMQILHNHGFCTKEEEDEQRRVIYSNTIMGMAVILRGMKSLGIQFEDPEREDDRLVVLGAVKAGKESEPFSPELAKALKALYKDKGVCVDAIKRGNEFQMPENVPHFLASIERISSPDYKTTGQDILLSQTKTTGIVEVKFQIKGVNFRVFDVGGHRPERQKWIHCFDDVKAVIFIAAISEYDQVLFEDETTNRMIESMSLFGSICNSQWFNKTDMILFLNKEDIYVEKIKRVSITVAFPDYEGGSSYDASTKYIEQKFDGLNANNMKTIFKHHTCATDTNHLLLILDSVIDMCIQVGLKGCGLF